MYCMLFGFCWQMHVQSHIRPHGPLLRRTAKEFVGVGGRSGACELRICRAPGLRSEEGLQNAVEMRIGTRATRNNVALAQGGR